MSNKLEANVNHNPAISISLDTSEGGEAKEEDVGSQQLLTTSIAVNVIKIPKTLE